MPVIVVVITGAAPNLRRLTVDQRNYRMIGDATAFDAVVVDDISESLFIHSGSR